MVEQRVPLKHETHSTPQRHEPSFGRYRSGEKCESIDHDPALVERLKRGDCSERCRLAGTGWSHQCHQLTRRDFERQRSQDVPRVEADAQPIDHEQRGHGARPPQRCSSRRARRASGSDIARYTTAHKAPGTIQLPTFVA